MLLVTGIQGHLWTETVRTWKQLHYMIFPRILALAERAWHNAEWEGADSEDTAATEASTEAERVDWEKFANTLGYKELSRLDEIGICYCVPLPGVK